MPGNRRDTGVDGSLGVPRHFAAFARVIGGPYKLLPRQQRGATLTLFTVHVRRGGWDYSDDALQRWKLHRATILTDIDLSLPEAVRKWNKYWNEEDAEDSAGSGERRVKRCVTR